MFNVIVLFTHLVGEYILRKLQVQWEIILKVDVLLLELLSLSHKTWFIMRNIYLKYEDDDVIL